MGTNRTRADFTKEEEDQLVDFLARFNPNADGRKGNELWKRLVDNFPWSSRHPYQSWRNHYIKDQAYFDRRVKRKVAKMKRVKPDPDAPTPILQAPSPSNSGRNPFTAAEKELLVQFLAKEHPDPSGRCGNVVYKELVCEEDKYPWAVTHPWQSWREQYVKHQKYYEERIAEYITNIEKRKSRQPLVPKSNRSREVDGADGKMMRKRSAQASDSDSEDYVKGRREKKRRRIIKPSPEQGSGTEPEVDELDADQYQDPSTSKHANKEALKEEEEESQLLEEVAQHSIAEPEAPARNMSVPQPILANEELGNDGDSGGVTEEEDDTPGSERATELLLRKGTPENGGEDVPEVQPDPPPPAREESDDSDLEYGDVVNHPSQAATSQEVPTPKTLGRKASADAEKSVDQVPPPKASQAPIPPTSDVPPQSLQKPDSVHAHQSCHRDVLVVPSSGNVPIPEERPAAPRPKRGKRPRDEDFFQDDTSPPPRQLVPQKKRAPPQLQEGPFNSAFTNVRGTSAFKGGIRRSGVSPPTGEEEGSEGDDAAKKLEAATTAATFLSEQSRTGGTNPQSAPVPGSSTPVPLKAKQLSPVRPKPSILDVAKARPNGQTLASLPVAQLEMSRPAPPPRPRPVLAPRPALPVQLPELASHHDFSQPTQFLRANPVTPHPAPVPLVLDQHLSSAMKERLGNALAQLAVIRKHGLRPVAREEFSQGQSNRQTLEEQGVHPENQTKSPHQSVELQPVDKSQFTSSQPTPPVPPPSKPISGRPDVPQVEAIPDLSNGGAPGRVETVVYESVGDSRPTAKTAAGTSYTSELKSPTPNAGGKEQRATETTLESPIMPPSIPHAPNPEPPQVPSDEEEDAKRTSPQPPNYRVTTKKGKQKASSVDDRTLLEPPERRHTVGANFGRELRGPHRRSLSFDDDANTSTITSTYGHHHRPNKIYRGRDLNTRDQEVAMAFGMEHCLQDMAKNHGFQIGVVYKVWQDLGDLKETDIFLGEMSVAADMRRKMLSNLRRSSEQELQVPQERPRDSGSSSRWKSRRDNGSNGDSSETDEDEDEDEDEEGDDGEHVIRASESVEYDLSEVQNRLRLSRNGGLSDAGTTATSNTTTRSTDFTSTRKSYIPIFQYVPVQTLGHVAKDSDEFYPPRESRAAQYARLVGEGRVEEARKRDHRRRKSGIKITTDTPYRK